MKRKRLICAILALALLCSASSAAFAAETGNTRTTVITTTTRMPVINVTVPGRGSVVINPLSLPVSVAGGTSREQIVSTPRSLVNKSDAPVTVDVSVAAAVRDGSDMTLASSPTGGTGAAKQAFIYFELHTSNSEEPKSSDWDAEYDADKHILVLDGVPQSKTGMITLAAKRTDGEIARGGYGPFRLTGDAVRNPDSAWTKADGVDVIITFTFTALPYADNPS